MTSRELALNIVPWVQILGLLFGALAVGATVQSFRLNVRTNKSRFIIDLTESFLKDAEAWRFWYRLNYDGGWRFDLKTFRNSAEERSLDTLLLRCCAVGQLLRNRSVSAADLDNLFFIVRQIFTNEQVREYLRFNVIDFWRVAGTSIGQLPDALYLYEVLTRWQVRQAKIRKIELDDCRAFIQQLHELPHNRELRHSIAERIDYDRELQ